MIRITGTSETKLHGFVQPGHYLTGLSESLPAGNNGCHAGEIPDCVFYLQRVSGQGDVWRGPAVRRR